MSFFSQQSQPQMTANLMAAEQEIDMVTEMFNRIVDACYTKCIPPKYQDGELTKGESVCVDRCVSKFFEVNVKVGKKLSDRGQQNVQAAGGM
ncbi:protein transporter tim10 [Sorochytrium milnesiophthora]